MTRIYTLIGIVSTMLLWGCQHDPETAPTGRMRVTFDNVVGDKDLVLNSGTYTNGSKETFSVSLFNYYVSNIKLLKADGTSFTVPQDSSYFLIRESQPATQTISVGQIPYGEYTGMEFMVGVDSLRNTMDVSKRTGVLDPAGGHSGGMYWDWNSGYIFLKLEGSSPQAVETAGTFMYHIGLFGGYQAKTLNNLRTVRVSFNTNKAVVGQSLTPAVQLRTDVATIFDGPTKISIAQHPDVMVSDFSAIIANNYSQMFRFVNLQSN
nr:MbnP family protein [uncultured Arsenicibacter sp.]